MQLTIAWDDQKPFETVFSSSFDGGLVSQIRWNRSHRYGAFLSHRATPVHHPNFHGIFHYKLWTIDFGYPHDYAKTPIYHLKKTNTVGFKLEVPPANSTPCLRFLARSWWYRCDEAMPSDLLGAPESPWCTGGASGNFDGWNSPQKGQDLPGSLGHHHHEV